jgi:hypothetical protein
MELARVPIFATDLTALQRSVTAWSSMVQDRLRAKHGERFGLNWTYTITQGTGRPIPAYNEEIALTDQGRPYARILFYSLDEQPRTVVCELVTCEPPFLMASKLFGGLAVLSALAAFCGWAYYLFVGGGWGRAMERFSHLGACRECASKLEIMYLFVLGWLIVPALAAVPAVFAGGLLDSGVDMLRHKLAWRKLKKELLPGLQETLGIIQIKATVDPRFGMPGVTHVAEGTAHESLPNIVWDGAGNLRPAQGYTWATDDVKSHEVKLKEEAAGA